MSKLVLARELRLGARGKDVRAVKRGLARAGHGTLAGSVNPLFGPFAVRHLKNFQLKSALDDDGVYGQDSHDALLPFFDRLARKLYEEKSEPQVVNPTAPADGSLQLPSTFISDHPTGGLPGFPAKDFFAHPNTPVLAPEDGVVDKLSGKDPSLGGRPGGAYGFSIYLRSATGRYFMTHFATRNVALGQNVKQGAVIGTVCDSAVSGKPNTSHIHMGKSVPG